jgi:hypothetical protein
VWLLSRRRARRQRQAQGRGEYHIDREIRDWEILMNITSTAKFAIGSKAGDFRPLAGLAPVSIFARLPLSRRRIALKQANQH